MEREGGLLLLLVHYRWSHICGGLLFVNRLGAPDKGMVEHRVRRGVTMAATANVRVGGGFAAKKWEGKVSRGCGRGEAATRTGG